MLLLTFLTISVVMGLVRASGEYLANRESYEAWAKDFKRDTSDKKFSQWIQSWHKVKALNDQHLSWTAGLTRFADMSEEDFTSTVLMGKNVYRKEDEQQEKNIKYLNKVYRHHHIEFKEGDDSFDWRDYGAVTPVQDQGFVGTCWAFSTVANVEGQFFLSSNKTTTSSSSNSDVTTPVKLSEEFLVDCDGSGDYDLNHADCSIFGGWPYLAYQFLMKKGGIPSEDSVPYCAGTGECYPCMKGPVDLCGPPPYYCDRDRDVTVCNNKENELLAPITNWGYVDSDESAMTASLQNIGPLSALLDAGTLQFYKGGVWTGSTNPDAGKLRTCSKTALNHAVLLTGYGVDEDTKQPFWSVKNSWGADWGEEGYFRILRGEGECGINTAVTSSSFQ